MSTFTKHKFLDCDSRKKILRNNSVNLVVTSPPYPMIAMWDEIFKSLNPKINLEKYNEAFVLMHKELAKVYKKAFRALKEGGFFIINIGDATRSFSNANFQLFPNSAKTIEICNKIGFTLLPRIYWNKPTNSPNKFLGSGMYPAGAYVTLETEHILIFRKAKKRIFTKTEEILRKKSAFFYNERNLWFANIWKDVLGRSQKTTYLNRSRNGAFPVELAYRLINMYSIEGDLVWDPFSGIGTTAVAAVMSARSSIMFDIDSTFINYSIQRIRKINVSKVNTYIEKRIQKAQNYIGAKIKNNEISSWHKNPYYGNVFSKQEVNIQLPQLVNIHFGHNFIKVEYSK